MVDTVCSAFWKHINIRSDNTIYACCRYKSPIAKFNGDMSDILYSDAYEKLRQNSLNGIANPNCSKCYHEESIGKTSVRQKYNQQYTNDSVELEFLEIAFDNICNLACDGCRSEFSSSWAIKENLNLSKKLSINSVTEISSVPESIRKISFLGGEPLMTNRHIDFLTTIKNKNNTVILYNTNGSFLLSTNAITLLNQFKLVEFALSIDGYKELNEQVREGSQWTDTLNFIDQIKQLGFTLFVNTVLHINNWQGIVDLNNFIHDNNLHWRINLLTFPANLDIVNLTSANKHQLTEMLDKINIPTDYQLYTRESIIKHMNKE